MLDEESDRMVMMSCNSCKHAYAKRQAIPAGDVTCMKGHLVRYNAPRHKDDSEWGWQPLGECNDHERREGYAKFTG